MKKLFALISLLILLVPTSIMAQSEEQIFVVVDKMPEFQGGTAAFNNFIRTNLKYPEEALKNKIEGVVIASFIVEKDGSVSNPTIISKVGYGCDTEVIRLINSMPKWIPGTKGGKAVRVKLSTPFEFKL